MRKWLFFLLLTCRSVNGANAQIIGIHAPAAAQTVQVPTFSDTTAGRKSQVQINNAGKKNTAPANATEPVTLILTNPDDSIKLPRASEEDWEAYAAAFDGLEKAITWDQYQNVENYINVEEDLGKLQMVQKQYLDRTAKVILRQLTSNINLLSQLLGKKLENSTELKLLNSIINNIHELISDYVSSVKLGLYNAIVMSIPIKVLVIGKNHAALNNVQCYFISRRTCRSIGCKVCEPGTDPCLGGDINAIINEADVSYDCLNPHDTKVNLGFYHVFVVSDNKIIFYTAKAFTASDAEAAREGSNEIKLFVQ
jgi:hypothetical protein